MTQGIFQGVLGIIFFYSLCWILSENRQSISVKSVGKGFFLQVILAVTILFLPVVHKGFHFVARGVLAIKEATLEGTSFVFGFLGGGSMPFDVQGNTFVFAFQALPMLIVISALSMLLFHWRILPWFVKGFSWVVEKVLGIGGALGTCAAAKVFFGQTEAPLFVKPYLKNMTRSEIFSVMCMGFATTSATIMGLYALVIDAIVPDAMVHILTASIISVPAALSLSQVVVPNTKVTQGHLSMPFNFTSSMDAVSQGTRDGLGLFWNIVAMLIVFIALVALVNKIFLAFAWTVGGEPLTLQKLLGYGMAPIAWVMGIPWSEALKAGSLLGIKAVLNEFYAFTELAQIKDADLSVPSRIIMTYALCGFANISSMGIMIGGFGALVEEKRSEITSLSFKALIVGTFSSCLSGTIMGLLLHFKG